MSCAFCCWVDAIQARAKLWPCCLQFVVEEVLGAHGMINYVDARTSWMDDIVKQAQWQGITQVLCPFLLPTRPTTLMGVAWHGQLCGRSHCMDGRHYEAAQWQVGHSGI